MTGKRPSPFRPPWLFGTLAILALAALFLRLATWQLQRLDARRAANTQLLARMEQPPITLAGSAVDVDAVDLRRATVRGSFDYDAEIVLRNRTWNGFPGVHVLVPLRLADGDAAILVDRGWIPYERAAPDQRGEFRGAAGEVTLTGIVRRSQVRVGPSPADPSPATAGRVDAWHRVDLPRIQEQVAYPMLPVYLEELPAGPPRAFPKAAPDVTLSEGSHLLYALQWLAFAVIAVVGYAVVYRQRTRRPPGAGPVAGRS